MKGRGRRFGFGALAQSFTYQRGTGTIYSIQPSERTDCPLSVLGSPIYGYTNHPQNPTLRPLLSLASSRSSNTMVTDIPKKTLKLIQSANHPAVLNSLPKKSPITTTSTHRRQPRSVSRLDWLPSPPSPSFTAQRPVYIRCKVQLKANPGSWAGQWVTSRAKQTARSGCMPNSTVLGLSDVRRRCFSSKLRSYRGPFQIPWYGGPPSTCLPASNVNNPAPPFRPPSLLCEPMCALCRAVKTVCVCQL